MKRLTILTLALAAITTFTSIASADAGAWNRHNRTRHGANHGQLTRNEAMRIRMGRLQILRLQRMAMADGRITMAERRMLQRAKIQQSRLVFRLMNNGRYA